VEYRARALALSRNEELPHTTGDAWMLNRRHFMYAGALMLAFAAGTAQAEDWKSKYKELTFAVVPAENASGVSDRYAPFMEYLTKELGVPRQAAHRQ
jgi:ABC-type phosphate/phosphonate transport system substrate-binding protein